MLPTILTAVGVILLLAAAAIAARARRVPDRQDTQHPILDRGLQYVLETMQDGLGTVDERGVSTYCNDRFCGLLDRPRESVLGRPITEFMHPDSRERFRAQFDSRKQGQNGLYECTWVRPDGQPVYTMLAATPLRDASGRFGGSFAIITDISPLKIAQQTLSTSEAKYRRVVESAHDPILVVDADTGIIVEANLRAAEFFDSSAAELAGRLATDLVAPDHRKHYAEVLGAIVLHGSGGVVRAELQTLAGERRTVDISAGIARDGDRTLVVGILRDLTASTHAEAALQASERRFREMADLLPDMIFEVDLDLRVVYANSAVLTRLGYTEADFAAGMYSHDVLLPEGMDQVHEEVQRKLRSGQTSVTFYNVRRKDGSLIPCEVHSMLIRAEDGTPMGVRGVSRDITERIRLEHSQRLAAVGQLAAGVAHEFNNLLNAMSAQAELAQSDPSGPNCDHLIHTVLMSTERGTEIARELMGLARPAAPERVPIPIRAPIEAALAMAGRELDRTRVNVERRYTEGLWVLGDAGQLQQVFLNLVINACQAMPEGGTLTVSTSREGGAQAAVVRLTDTGVGIPATSIGRIFEPFFTTRSDEPHGGSGLGLSISHRIVSAHDGSIAVASEPGQGATFTVTLEAVPAPIPAPQANEPAPLAPAAVAAGGRRILIAEDGALLAGIFATMLQREGMVTTVATHTEDAIRELSTGAYDLVISDLLMPGGGGRAVLEAARQLPHPPIILIMTGAVDEAQEAELANLGAAAVLRKPVRQAVLLQHVHAALEPTQ